jgi:hypothetical protein
MPEVQEIIIIIRISQSLIPSTDVTTEEQVLHREDESA